MENKVGDGGIRTVCVQVGLQLVKGKIFHCYCPIKIYKEELREMAIFEQKFQFLLHSLSDSLTTKGTEA